MAANESIIPTPASPDVVTMEILRNGKTISPQYAILHLLVRKETNRIPTAVIHLDDGEASKSTFAVSNTDEFIPGHAIEIKIGYKGENKTVFKGIITHHSIKIREGGSMLIIECKDECVKMAIQKRSHYYIDKKESDILEEIISRYKLAKEVDPLKTALKEVVQFESTDWDFMLCRAEANALLVNVSDGKIVISKPATEKDPVLNVTFGSSLLELDAEIDARVQSKSIITNSWNATEQKMIQAEARDPKVKNAGNLTPEKLAEVTTTKEDSLNHGGKISLPELQSWADSTLQRERLAKIRGRAKFSGFTDILPGMMISLAGIGQRFEGNAYVAGVMHTVSKGSWWTDVQFGIHPEIFARQFDLQPTPSAGLLPGITGLHIGIVTALENDPDGEHRIKVRLPIISTKEEGIWARISTLDAGKERGTFFRPEINDEVIVGFLNEDPRHPVVLGMCHSSAHAAPEQAANTNHRKGYVSRSKMKFTFDDDKKIVLLETPAGNSLCLNEDEKSLIIKDQHGNKITLNDKGISIESFKDLEIKAVSNITSDGVNIDLKAKTGFKATGNGSAEVSGASTSIKGSASTVIQGGLVRIN